MERYHGIVVSVRAFIRQTSIDLDSCLSAFHTFCIYCVHASQPVVALLLYIVYMIYSLCLMIEFSELKKKVYVTLFKIKVISSLIIEFEECFMMGVS